MLLFLACLVGLMERCILILAPRAGQLSTLKNFRSELTGQKKKNLPAREKQLGPSLGPPKQEKDHLSEGGAKFGKIKKSPL